MVTDPIKFVYLVGDGVTTDFSYAYNGTVGFDADVADDVKAAILNPDGTRDTNPNFAVMQDTYGNFVGKIRFAVAPVANAIIYIYRVTPQTQETEYKTSSGFDAKVVEENFDKITKILQEISLHAKNKTIQLDPFQEQKIALELLSASNNGQYLILDTINWVIKAGLFLEITSDNRFRVSKDGEIWIYLPKSENVQEVRQRVYLDEENVEHKVFEYRVGSEWYDVLTGVSHTGLLDRDAEDSHPISAITGLQDKLDEKLNTESAEETYATKTELSSHTENTDNPHSVTKAQVGLGNVDNTSDANKPISTATQNALNGKLSIKQNPQDAGKVVKVGSDGNLEFSSEGSGGGLQSVSHGATLKGAGTDLQPLDVADGSIGNTQLAQEVKQEIAGKQPAGNYATEESLSQGLSGKADKATTLDGYGITDGATKTELTDGLNNRANIDLSNLSTQGKTFAAAASLPVYSFIEIDLQTSGQEFTAPFDGWIVFSKQGNLNQNIRISKFGLQTFAIAWACTDDIALTVFLPVIKNERISFLYTATGPTNFCWFLRAQGVAQ